MFMPRGIWGLIQPRLNAGGKRLPALLSLRDVTIRFGGLTALDSFSMEVVPGSIHALIGPNGAGKSTAFNAITRLYRQVSGQIFFDGREISGVPTHRLAGMGIGRTFRTSSCSAE